MELTEPAPPPPAELIAPVVALRPTLEFELAVSAGAAALATAFTSTDGAAEEAADGLPAALDALRDIDVAPPPDGAVTATSDAAPDLEGLIRRICILAAAAP